VKRLTGWAALLLYSETPNVHVHTLTIAVVELVDLGGRTFRIEIRRAAGLSEQPTVVATVLAQ
jgi:hypothetical protein